MIRNYLNIAKCVLALIVLLFVIISCDTKVNFDSEWDNDLDLLTEKLEKYHPNPWENISREKYLQEIDIIKKNSNKWNNEKVILELKKVIADIGDGHTELSLNNKDQFNLWFPVRIEKFYDGLFITGISDEFPNILKAKILRIGKKKQMKFFLW